MPDFPSETVILNDYAFCNGGSSAVAIASATALAARGVAVTFFSCVGPVAPQLRNVPGLEVVCLDQPDLVGDPHRLRAAVSGLHNARAARSLRRLLAGRDPGRTVVHAHTWTKALSPTALRVVTAAGFRLVVTLHDFFIACPTGGFFEHPAGRLCRRPPLSWSCLGCNCDRRSRGHKLWRFGRTLLQNRFLNIPHDVVHYIGVSESGLQRLRPWLPAGASASVLRPPVDGSDAGPAPVASNRNFLFVGRLVSEKGVRQFAAAVRETGLPAVFAGDGELMPELRRTCPAARFTGWLDAAGIRAEVRRARALVFPSLWYETLGLVAIESAAAGVPALVADHCAATDHIRHGVNGLHFRSDTPGSLARAMRAVATDDVLVARLGDAAYRWYWREPWTLDRHVDGLLSVYRSLRRPAPAATQEDAG